MQRIIARLIAEPGVSAGAFSDRFDAVQPTISRHLAQLKRAGLVTRRVSGRSHSFLANPKTLSAADAWLGDHRDF